MRDATTVYRQFISFEEEAASIYLRMASCFCPSDPELTTLWLDMGMQEKQHAGLLQFCLAEELFSEDLPTESEIRQVQELFASLKRRAADPELPAEEAFRIAAEMESSEVNTIYNRLTTPAHSSMYLLRRKIATSMPDHVGHLLQAARKFSVSAETLEILERQAAKCCGAPPSQGEDHEASGPPHT